MTNRTALPHYAYIHHAAVGWVLRGYSGQNSGFQIARHLLFGLPHTKETTAWKPGTQPMAARSRLAWPCLAVDGQDAVKVVAFVLQQFRQRSRQSAPMVRAACEAQDEN